MDSQQGLIVQKVKMRSFVIAMAICSLIHGFVPGSFLAMVVGILWAFFGYKRVFRGWPEVTALRQSGRAFILALLWPITALKR